MNMIEVKNVTMKFRLASDKIQSLKEYFIAVVTRKLKYKELCVFSDLNFEIKKGEVVGIIGRNGAGKSTLLKIISGVLAPTEGTVKSYGNIVPMLELGSGFDIELSGRENIFLNGSILGYSKKFLEEKYDEILEFSELGDFIEEPIRNYSSGMLMRLAFSIATIVHPEILIVDEILAVGDEAFQRKSKRKMLELMGGGTTVLFVSHSIDQIREMCSRVIWIENGRNEKDGDAKEVCDAYQLFLNPKQDIYQSRHKNDRNLDAYKYIMDVLIVYNEDDLSYYSALARKEQLLIGNICAQELCIADMDSKIIGQYRTVLFINCRTDCVENFIVEIDKKNKTYIVECHTMNLIDEWTKKYPQASIISFQEIKMKLGFNISCFPVPITERLQQVATWAGYDRDILPYKDINEIEGEQELINYNKVVLERKKHEEDGIRVGVICNLIDKELVKREIEMEIKQCDFTIKLIGEFVFEDITREIAKMDFIIDMSNGILSRRINEVLCSLLDVPYFENSDQIEQILLDKPPRKKMDCNGEFKESTIATGVKFADFVRKHMNESIVYLLKQYDEKITSLPRLKDFIKNKRDITIFASSSDAEVLKHEDVELCVINKNTKYVFGSFDTVVVMDEEEFDFVVTYPNIRKRVYFVSCWGPDKYDCGDFNKIRVCQTYSPCVDVEFWAESEEISNWLKVKYNKQGILIE